MTYKSCFYTCLSVSQVAGGAPREGSSVNNKKKKVVVFRSAAGISRLSLSVKLRLIWGWIIWLSGHRWFINMTAIKYFNYDRTHTQVSPSFKFSCCFLDIVQILSKWIDMDPCGKRVRVYYNTVLLLKAFHKLKSHSETALHSVLNQMMQFGV